MLMSVLLNSKRYTFGKYARVVLMTVGVALFMYHPGVSCLWLIWGVVMCAPVLVNVRAFCALVCACVLVVTVGVVLFIYHLGDCCG